MKKSVNQTELYVTPSVKILTYKPLNTILAGSPTVVENPTATGEDFNKHTY